MTIRTKICCKTYKKNWSVQKKVVPLQRENKNSSKYNFRYNKLNSI